MSLRGLSPTRSFGFQQVELWVFAGSVTVLSSLKFLLSSDGKRQKEAPMEKASKSGIRSVLETLWAIGTSYIAVLLPG